MKEISAILLIVILGWSAIVHVLRLINLYYPLPFLSRVKFIRAEPSKTEMALYYVLVIGIAIYVVYLKLTDNLNCL